MNNPNTNTSLAPVEKLELTQSGGSDYGDTEKDLRVSAPKAKFNPGIVLNGMSEQKIKDWTKTMAK